ncbi:MAG: GTPase ObgE [Bacteroidota bacterium]|nr:GTPase ObgE [Bacteroidota bacterium]
MADSNFVDYVKICCRSGRGGQGCMHFHRDKHTTKGGPDGGDGGKGGSIILRGNSQLWTLLHLKYRKHIIAEEGNNGQSGLRSGKDGKVEIIDVPLGTVAKDAETGAFMFEVTRDGEEHVLLAGGRGGLGNHHFKNSINQNPRFAQPGEEGKEEWKILELKILADVGLVGFPNAGKSTLLSVVTAAKPEIADYPFTTLVPNLGIVNYRNYQSFVMADIPGIIEGAHEGKGLGTRFLRHIERNATLLFMVPATSEDIKAEYNILLKELKLHNKELTVKNRLLAITKCDLLEKEELTALKKILPKIPTVFISAASNFGIEELKDKLWELINKTT